VPNFKAYYKSLSYLTKHFLVRSMDGPTKSVARHYTICNAMRPDVYKMYINALKPETDPEFKALDLRILDKSDRSSMTFCIKNYGQPRGLSTMIHAEDQNERRFEVKGPMGHGLRVKPTGVHVAFAAGTGALCFVDLVAWLIKANAGRGLNLSSSVNEAEMSEEIDASNFQFHLYVSYPKRADGVALELFEALDAYCKRENIPNFSLYVRLSQEKVNPQRWDDDFIRQEIDKYGAKNLQRVWVCGPPVMSETFDRCFSSPDPERGNQVNHDDEPLIGDNSTLQPHQYEIL